MAEKRMFTMQIVDSDAFLDMPLSTQALYFHLNMRADDDGFVNNPKKIQRTIGATEDDLKLLLAKRFVLSFENGVIVIKHWRMHNLLRKDRYKPTQYQDEFHLLSIKENGAYTELATNWQPTDNQLTTNGCQTGAKRLPQDRIGKDRLGKVSIGEDRVGDYMKVIDKPAGSQQDIPTLPLLDGSEWQPEQKDLQEWQKFYNRVDIVYELGRMRQWCKSNPNKQKTAYEVRNFVTKWLDQEQRKTKGRQATGADAYYELAQEAMNGTAGN